MGEDVHVSVSSEIGSMGLIERENATILNAALWQVAESLHRRASPRALAGEGRHQCPDVYLSQNDGTLMTMELRPALPHPDHRLRPHQLHPWRQLPEPAEKRHRHRCGRHHHRPGGDPERVPQRVQRGGHHRRRAHQLPDARRGVHRLGRRLHRAAEAGRHRHRGPGHAWATEITEDALCLRRRRTAPPRTLPCVWAWRTWETRPWWNQVLDEELRPARP